MEDLSNLKAQVVVAFLNPIFHLEKPRWLVAKWVATFLKSMRKKIIVDLANLIYKLVD